MPRPSSVMLAVEQDHFADLHALQCGYFGFEQRRCFQQYPIRCKAISLMIGFCTFFKDLRELIRALTFPVLLHPQLLQEPDCMRPHSGILQV
jgi:hypothetical protein